MPDRDAELTPLMRRVRTQAEILVPLLKALRAELGTDAANALVFPVLRRQAQAWTAKLAPAGTGDPVAEWEATIAAFDVMFEGDVDVDVLTQNDERLEVNVTGCRYADFFRRIGEPELGTILVCELDDHIAARSSPDVSLSRSDTLMNGGAVCPFRFRFRRRAK